MERLAKKVHAKYDVVARKPEGATKKVSMRTVWRHIANIDHHLIDMDRPQDAGIYQRMQHFKDFWFYPKFPIKDINTFGYNLHDDKLENAQEQNWSDPGKVPAIVVERDPDTGRLDVIDGAHRLAVAEEKGLKWLPAYVGEPASATAAGKPYPATRLFPFSGQGQRPPFNLSRESNEVEDDEKEVPNGDLSNEYNPDLLNAYDERQKD